MRKFTVIGAVSAMLVAAIAIPALADKPLVIDDMESFVAPNPCTGLMEMHTIYWTTADHLDHNNNLVVMDKNRHGETESGFVMKGQFHVSENKNGVTVKLRDTWKHPDTGEKFVAKQTFRVRGSSPVVDEFTLECLTGPTLLP